MSRLLALLVIALLAPAMSYAQSTWPTPQTATGGPTVPGGVAMCLNVSGQAIPCSPGTPQYQKSGTYASAGAGQYALSVATATSLTVPTGATIAEICVETAGVRYRDDGAAPTATTGIPVSAGTCFPYGGPLSAIQFIAQSGSPAIDVSYYK